MSAPDSARPPRSSDEPAKVPATEAARAAPGVPRATATAGTGPPGAAAAEPARAGASEAAAENGEGAAERVPQQRPAEASSACAEPLLVVVDPQARRVDAESARIARDVLCAGAPGVKLCLPEDAEETAATLLRCGRRRPVLVGDDRALQRTLGALHAERELQVPLSVVPVGEPSALAIAGGLGVPLDAVAAARAVLGGVERRLDLLADDAGGVAAGALRIPEPPGYAESSESAGGALARACRSLVRPRPSVAPPARLRVEADGESVAPAGAPAAEVAVATGGGDGYAEVVVRCAGVSGARALRPPWRRPGGVSAGSGPSAESAAGAANAEPNGAEPAELRFRARRLAVEVVGEGVRYRADATVDGPVRFRVWRVLPAAWRLVLPQG